MFRGTGDVASIMNPVMTAGPDRGFAATYDGDACFPDVVVLIEFFDRQRVPELTLFDMCAAIGPTVARPRLAELSSLTRPMAVDPVR